MNINLALSFSLSEIHPVILENFRIEVLDFTFLYVSLTQFCALHNPEPFDPICTNSATLFRNRTESKFSQSNYL